MSEFKGQNTYRLSKVDLILVLQVSKVAESLVLPCAMTLMGPHLAPIRQRSPLKPSTGQKSAPKQNMQEVSENTFYIMC